MQLIVESRFIKIAHSKLI